MDGQPLKRDPLADAGDYESSQYIKEPVIIVQFKERQFWAETLEHENRLEISDFLPRRRPQGATHIENSFEKSFLAEHIKTLGTILQKSEESISAGSQADPNGYLCPTPQPNLPTLNQKSASSFIRSLHSPQTDAHHNQFLKDLKHKGDLDSFLSYLISNFREDVARCLVIVTIDFWTEARSLKFSDLEKGDLLRKAEAWTHQKGSSFFEREDFSCMVGGSNISESSQGKNVLLEKFKEKIRCYIGTVLFIVAGFFQNPYCEGATGVGGVDVHADYPKRQFPRFGFDFLSGEDFDSDSEISFQPGKKVKTE